jgi:hypothetical protein
MFKPNPKDIFPPYTLGVLGSVLGFAFLVDFLVVAGPPEQVEVYKTELKPFLAISGTCMRALDGLFLRWLRWNRDYCFFREVLLFVEY